MTDEIVIGMAGLGTVGSGVYNVLKRNADLISKRCGHSTRIKTVVCRNLEKARLTVDEKVQLTQNWEEIANDPDINIVIEVMGGIEPAKSLILAALRNGKDVITANKALLATHGNEIFKVAKACHRTVAFEASVAGGIPIIKTLREGLSANRIEWIAGIINGTSNYILTQMQEKGCSFQMALEQAQALGYAEADPTFDIEGIDAGHKIAILSALAFGTEVHFDERHISGISTLKLEDIECAKRLGYQVKLLGITRQQENGVDVRVHPTLVPENGFLSKVNNVMNAVVVKADAVNTVKLVGPGAGSEPTASAVIADLVDVIKGRSEPPEFEDCNSKWLNLDEVVSAFYVRIPLENLSEEEIMTRFEENGMTLVNCISDAGQLCGVTNEVNEGQMRLVWESLMKRMEQPKDAQLLHVFVD